MIYSIVNGRKVSIKNMSDNYIEKVINRYDNKFYKNNRFLPYLKRELLIRQRNLKINKIVDNVCV